MPLLDPALGLLIRLRAKGWLRRARRAVATPKGAVLTVLGLVFFLPSILGIFFAPRKAISSPEAVLRFGPMMLLVYVLLTLISTSASDRILAFSPAEVNFLFAGPFRPRQILAYRVTIALLSCLASGLFMMVFFWVHAGSFLAGFMGLMLALVFVQMFAMAIGLAQGTVAAFAFNRRRKVTLVLLAALAIASLAPLGARLLTLPPLEILSAVEKSTAYRVATAPLRPFILAFAARRIFPDLVQWAAVAAAIDAALIAIVFALDAQYLETSAEVGAKYYERIERMRRSGGTALLRPTARAKSTLRMFPYWGGAGPVLWRQATTVRRDLLRLLLAAASLLPMAIVLLINGPAGPRNPAAAFGLQVFVLGFGLVLGMMVPFDFRADIDRMADLKTLPIRPTFLALGQILTPTLAVTFIQWIFIALFAWRGGARIDWTLGLALIAPSLNLLLVAIDNALFLWMPYRMPAGQAIDFQAMGRMMLAMLAKFASTGVVLGAAGVLGLAVYYVGGGLYGTFAAVWFVVTAMACLSVPVVGLLFARLDPSRDTPPA